MQPQREGYDEPEPTGHQDSTRTIYNVGWPVNRLPRSGIMSNSNSEQVGT